MSSETRGFLATVRIESPLDVTVITDPSIPYVPSDTVKAISAMAYPPSNASSSDVDPAEDAVSLTA